MLRRLQSVGGGVLGAGALSYYYYRIHSHRFPTQQPQNIEAVAAAEYKLPVFSREELAKHNSKENRIWVSFQSGVYDVTDFVDIHPGGEKILLAAGTAIDPFWQIFSIHNSESTRELLEEYRIGNLKPCQQPPNHEPLKSLFENDPAPFDGLNVKSRHPLNAESPAALLHEFVTPNESFFIRNHLPVPSVTEDSFVLTICIPGIPEQQYSLHDLKQFPEYIIMNTFECAGNRRNNLDIVKKVRGILWGVGAIGNCVWSGPRLIDVLKDAWERGKAVEDTTSDEQGIQYTKNGLVKCGNTVIQHVQFEGLDSYGASIPIKKVLDPLGDVLLAIEMNGENIPKHHGYPLRVIVPGHVAARSVKWVHKIILSDEESQSHWQRRDYKGFSPSKTLESSDYSVSKSIQEMPVQSAITYPLPNQTVSLIDGTVCIKGYAYSGGGRGIVRVDVSTDNGITWHDAVLFKANQPDGREWAWSHWEVNIPAQKGPLNIVCKAVDTSYNEQPQFMESIYNVRGVLVSAWHRIKIVVE